jgi:VWFA-related protein
VSRLYVLVVCALATASLHGQGGPTFRTGANYVRVDMYATRDGQPVEDLRPDEIDLLEDGVVQKVERFEHVKVAPAGSQDLRVEPTTVEQSRAMAADGRARVFIIFLDTHHTTFEGSATMRLPLVRFLDRLMGADDMVALMTPEMSARDVAFGRKTTVISNIMQDEVWGRKGRVTSEDPKEALYEACYPPVRGDDTAAEMKARRREKLTLDALEDLIVHLNGVREERKAVLAVTEGWRIFGQNPRLARFQDGREIRPGDVLGRPPQPRAGEASTTSGTNRIECETDRQHLAALDHSTRLRDLGDSANRSNVTFYPVYARGLVANDADPAAPGVSQQVDRQNLAARQDSMRFLADATDGTAVLNTNRIDEALKRITDDLSSYYLLGYTSSNAKLDGKFRNITVRVKRPDVRVRARRGYRGRTAEELLSGTTSESAVDAPVTSALTTVAALNNRAQFRIRTSAWSRPSGGGAFFLVGELDFKLRRELAWTAGAEAELVVIGAAGDTVLSRDVKIPANEGVFSVEVPESGGLAPGEYAVRVRLRPEGDGDLSVSDLARVTVGASSPLGEAVMWRRGPSTGPRYLRTADPRFTRSERIRLELAAASPEPATARVLDRLGKPLQIPAQVTVRPDPGGFTWVVVDAALAPLAMGDYAIEVTQGTAKQVTAFKLVP